MALFWFNSSLVLLLSRALGETDGIWKIAPRVEVGLGFGLVLGLGAIALEPKPI